MLYTLHLYNIMCQLSLYNAAKNELKEAKLT